MYRVSTGVWKTSDKCEVDRTVQLVVEESLDWPNVLWFGAARFSLRRCGTSLQPGWRLFQRCTRMELCT